MEINREDALKELGYDVITSSPYDLLKAVEVNTSSTEIKPVYLNGGNDIERNTKVLDEFSEWLTAYKNLNKPERLSISDIAVTTSTERLVHGTMLIVNGMNGMTQVSRQSLKHIMDIMGHLEDRYGARVYLSQVSSHSDVFYYMLSFVIWKDGMIARDTHEWGNLKPLYHIETR
jgi:hypothetical protein